MDPNGKAYELDKLFATKERNIDSHIKALTTLRRGGKIRTDSLVEITKLEGHAQKIFAHFFSKLRSERKHEKDCNYKDFSFTSIAFLAGDLLFAEKIYEECRASYITLQEQYATKPSSHKDELKKLPKVLINIQEKIDQIKEVQRLFLVLLENCQLR
jgi:hypothetical protein